MSLLSVYPSGGLFLFSALVVQQEQNLVPQIFVRAIARPVARNAKFQRRVCAIVLSVLALLLSPGSSLLRNYPVADVLHPLLIGFLPLIGWFMLLAFLVVLYVVLLCKVEAALAGEADRPVREGISRSRWHRVSRTLPSLLAEYISRTEHSPPEPAISQ